MFVDIAFIKRNQNPQIMKYIIANIVEKHARAKIRIEIMKGFVHTTLTETIRMGCLAKMHGTKV